MDTRKGCKGTAVFHLLNNRRKRLLTNENLIAGRLQWTRFHSRNKPINLITVYTSGRNERQETEEEEELMNNIIQLLLTLEDEYVIIAGDMNINTHNPKTGRDKDWQELIDHFNLKELKNPQNYTYVRAKSRPDHIFVSQNIKIIKEVMLPPVTKNDHIPFYVDLELDTVITYHLIKMTLSIILRTSSLPKSTH